MQICAFTPASMVHLRGGVACMLLGRSMDDTDEWGCGPYLLPDMLMGLR